PDINAVAVPFQAATGEGLFVMSCGGPASLLPEAELRARGAPARRAAAGLLSGGARCPVLRPSCRGAGISYNSRIDSTHPAPGATFGHFPANRSAARRPPLAPGFRNGLGRTRDAGRGHGGRLAAARAIAGRLSPRRRAYACLPGAPRAGRAAGQDPGRWPAAPAGSARARRRIIG